jgi:hypothetical protein
LYKHRFWTQLGQTTDMPHMSVGKKNTIGLAQAVRPLRMCAQNFGQQIQLELDVRRSINQPNTIGHGPSIHNCQTGCVFDFAAGAMGTLAANMGQSTILHTAQENGRYLPYF